MGYFWISPVSLSFFLPVSSCFFLFLPVSLKYNFKSSTLFPSVVGHVESIKCMDKVILFVLSVLFLCSLWGYIITSITIWIFMFTIPVVYFVDLRSLNKQSTWSEACSSFFVLAWAEQWMKLVSLSWQTLHNNFEPSYWQNSTLHCHIFFTSPD